MPTLPPQLQSPPPIMSLRTILRWLFLEPARAPMLQAESPWRGIRVFVATVLLCGIGIGLIQGPELCSSLHGWGGWLHRTTGRMWVKGGKLGWETPAAMPYTTRHEGWRVDFMPAGSKFPGNAAEGPEVQGIWLSPDQATLWFRADEKGTLNTVPVFQDGLLWNARELAVADQEIDLEGIAASAKFRGFVTATVLVLQSLWMAFISLMYLTLFAVVPVLLRSPWARRGFLPLFGFYCFMAVPPVLVAAVYSALGLPGLDFSMLFTCGFLAYVMLMVWMVRRANPSKENTSVGDDF